MKELECSQDFSQYKSMGIFPDPQGQLTPQSLVQSSRISNSSEMLWMFLLPASMKKIRSKTRVGTMVGGRTGLVVRASGSGSGDPGSILGRVGVLFPCARDIYSPKVLVIPRNRWLRLKMTEKLFTGMLNHNQKTKKEQWSYKRSPDYCPGITTTMKNKKHCCKRFLKICAVAQQ